MSRAGYLRAWHRRHPGARWRYNRARALRDNRRAVHILGVRVRWRLLALALAAVPLHAQQPPASPRPKPEALALIHAAAAIADGVTTHRVVSSPGGHEVGPSRILIGSHPSDAKMAAWGAAEVTGVYLLARKWPRLRWLQVALTGAHAVAAAHNARVE